MRKLNNQKGAVLVISMIMLLLLTLIGTTSMQSSSSEERMAGNSRDDNLAFQAAEAALRAGELASLSGVFVFANNGINGLYTTTAGGSNAINYFGTVDWTNPAKYGTFTGLSYVTSQPKYIVEELAATISSATTTTLPATTHWYRITARGTGSSDNTVVKLQSIFSH